MRDLRFKVSGQTIEKETECDFTGIAIETDLTEAQIQAYKSLTTFKPTSIISNDANAQMEVEYVCDTKTWVTNKINTLIKEATTS